MVRLVIWVFKWSFGHCVLFCMLASLMLRYYTLPLFWNDALKILIAFLCVLLIKILPLIRINRLVLFRWLIYWYELLALILFLWAWPTLILLELISVVGIGVLFLWIKFLYDFHKYVFQRTVCYSDVWKAKLFLNKIHRFKKSGYFVG